MKMIHLPLKIKNKKDDVHWWNTYVILAARAPNFGRGLIAMSMRSGGANSRVFPLLDCNSQRPINSAMGRKSYGSLRRSYPWKNFRILTTHEWRDHTDFVKSFFHLQETLLIRIALFTLSLEDGAYAWFISLIWGLFSLHRGPDFYWDIILSIGSLIF